MSNRVKLSTYALVVMMAGIHISLEIFSIYMLRALKASLEHERKHVVRLLLPYGGVVRISRKDSKDKS